MCGPLCMRYSLELFGAAYMQCKIPESKIPSMMKKEYFCKLYTRQIITQSRRVLRKVALRKSRKTLYTGGSHLTIVIT